MRKVSQSDGFVVNYDDHVIICAVRHSYLFTYFGHLFEYNSLKLMSRTSVILQPSGSSKRKRIRMVV
uniref:Uncharacterized protein n=1 Tax=Rhizophora mucronata TaxID=61149 RepID=A0A2P2P6N8_RHIMU